MKKTLSISVLACALALTFAVPALAHGRQACRQDPVCQETHLCGENYSYLDEDGDGICDHCQDCPEDCPAYSSAENNDQPDCRTESRAPAADTAEGIIPAAVMEDTADAETG